ncbi:MAG: hypothetical protein O2955_16590 [Planctomycetota bacterium]|nr:hypothetical protein [Planctomycetota bacterium]MDA1214132.1 hypothetical protein [Planctomycetota bacterium]
MQFGHKLLQIGLMTGLFLLIAAGHRLAKTPASFKSSLTNAAPHTFVASAFPQHSGAIVSPLAANASDTTCCPFFSSSPNVVQTLETTTIDRNAVPDPFDDTGAQPIESGHRDGFVRINESEHEVAALTDAPPLKRSNDSPSKTISDRRNSADKSDSSESNFPPDTDRAVPQKIVDSDNAVPLPSDHKSTGAFDSLFDDEWPDATREEREIWGSQLKGIPPETVRELLRLRQHHTVIPPQRFGPRIPVLDHDSVSPSSPIVDDDASTEPNQAQTVRLAMSVLHTAQTVTLQNLIHARTPGYKARIINYADRIPAELFAVPQQQSLLTDDNRPTDSARGALYDENILNSDVDTLEFDQQINIQPGTLRETRRTWDVAIEGRGWFRVTKDSNTFYTRNGRWALNESRVPVLLAGGTEYVVYPSIVIPEEASKIIISAKGEVIYKTEPKTRPQPEPGEVVPLGTIAIYDFLDESALAPVVSSIYAETPASGKPIDLSTGDNVAGIVKQGFLEDANVDVDQEAKHWQQLQMFQQMLAELFPETSSVASRRSATHQ